LPPKKQRVGSAPNFKKKKSRLAVLARRKERGGHDLLSFRGEETEGICGVSSASRKKKCLYLHCA